MLQPCFGWQASNPFELEYRIPNDSLQYEVQKTGNPFDVYKVQPKKPIEKNQISTLTQQKKPLSANSNRQFLFWTIIGILVLLSFLVTIDRSVFTTIYKAFTNQNFLNLIHREQKTLLSLPLFILYFIFIVNLALFIALVLIKFSSLYHTVTFNLLSWLILAISIVFILKHLILRLLSYLIPKTKEIRVYSFTIVIFNIIAGLSLVPINILVGFGPEVIANLLIYIGLGIIGLCYLYRALRSLFLANKFILFHKFHFFIYLCTVEIAPMLILTKFILNNANNI